MRQLAIVKYLHYQSGANCFAEIGWDNGDTTIRMLKEVMAAF
jgi:hypothetical protein